MPQQGNNPSQEWTMMWAMTKPINKVPIQPMNKTSTQPSSPATGMYTPTNNEHNATVVDNAEDGGLDEATGV